MPSGLDRLLWEEMMVEVLSELLGYLHNQDLYLPPGFNENLIPMIRNQGLQLVQEHIGELYALAEKKA